MPNKSFIQSVANDSGLSTEEVTLLLKCFGQILTETGEELNAVSLPRFGTFTAIKDDERVDVDLSSGRRLLLPPCIRLDFTPSGALRNAVNEKKKGGQA